MTTPIKDDVLHQAAVDDLNQAKVNIAVLEQQVEHLSDSVKELRDENKSILEKLDKIQTTLSEARGGWQLMMWIGGAAASMGAGISWVATHLQFKG